MLILYSFAFGFMALFFLDPSQTPPKFDWSIDEMASLLPVHIDQEEIQRQSFYLSQTRYLLEEVISDEDQSGPVWPVTQVDANFL